MFRVRHRLVEDRSSRSFRVECQPQAHAIGLRWHSSLRSHVHRQSLPKITTAQAILREKQPRPAY